MILLTLLITFLLKINFISCQVPVTPLKTGYDQKLAKHLFILTANSYSSYPGRCMPKLIPYFKSFVFVRSLAPRCDKHKNRCPFYLLEDLVTKTLILVFSGSQGASQLFYQTCSIYSKSIDFFGLGKANEYFVKAHIMLWEHIENIIKNPFYHDFKFIVTGHSLGGALAALAALRIQITQIKQSKDIVLYTFGEPRVGTLLFSMNFDKRVPRSYRIVYGYDFISHMPPCKKEKEKRRKISIKRKTLPCSRQDNDGYYHHGTEIWYPKGSSPQDHFYECLGFPKNEDFRCSDGLFFKKHKYFKLRAHHSDYFVDMQEKYIYIVNHRIFKNCTTY